MYAIIKTGGKQYTVKPGEYLDVERLDGVAGDKVDVEVLFVNDGKKILTGAEAAQANVVAEIVDQHKGDKVIVFKFKKRKGYKRTRGHRQQLTRIMITEINGVKAEAKKAAKPKKADKKTESKKAEAKKDDAKKAEKSAQKTEEKTAKSTEQAAKTDYSKLTVDKLKDLAKEKDIEVPAAARKADIIELLENA